MLSTDFGIGFGVWEEEVASRRPTHEILLAALEKFEVTSSIEFLGIPFEKKWHLAWFPTVLLRVHVVLKPSVLFSLKIGILVRNRYSCTIDVLSCMAIDCVRRVARG